MKRRLQISAASLVILFLVMGVYFLYHDLSSLVSQEKSQLEKTAYVISRLIPTAQLELVALTKDSQTASDSQLQDRIFSLQNDLQLTGNVTVLDISQTPAKVLSSSRMGLKKGDALEVNPMDLNQFSTHPTSNAEIYRRGASFHMSALAPIRGSEGQVLAALLVESDSSATILRLIGYGLHYLLLAIGLITIGGFLFFWLTNKTSRSLERMRSRYFTLFNESSEGIVILDPKGLIVRSNETASQILQIPSSALEGKDLFQIEHFSFIPLDPTKDVQKLSLEAGVSFRSKAKIVLTGDRIRYVQYSSSPLRDGKKIIGALLLIQDITADLLQEQETFHQLKKENEILLMQALTDPLTGCFNRQYLFMSLEAHLSKPEVCSLLMIDLDNFKKINDTEGHQRGDEVLKTFGKFLTGFFRRSDKIIRYGGDEFVVILPSNDIHSANRIARNMIEKMKISFNASSATALTASVGVAEREQQETAERWLQRADEALYRAKRSGKAKAEINREDQLEIIG